MPSPVRRRRAARDGWVTLLAVALLLTLAGCAGREMTRVSTPAPATPEVLPAAPEEDVRSASRSVEPISRERTVAVDHSAAASDASDLLRGPSAGEATIRTGGGHSTVEELLAAGLHLAGASPVHLAIRGTAGAATVRCAWRGIARTTAQREDAIRFWLQLDENETVPDAAVVEALFTATFDVLNPAYRETAKANFLAIARGGLSNEYLFLTCFADYAVTNYLLGTGTTPGTVTVAYDNRDEAASYELYRREHEAGTFGSEPLQTPGDYEASLQEIVVEAEETLAAEVGGKERIVFLAPLGRTTRSRSRPGRWWRTGTWRRWMGRSTRCGWGRRRATRSTRRRWPT